ncbi:MAG: endoglucanase Y [Roseibaca calidilacus]|uniref:cellulase n=1 Tax=Roseibaca calidilacus TaxID=1666912 RepID=A0A0P7YR43_9RHOB|nr:glycosyl hydrolase family 8 [Roseibaca calidilacus]KPP91579.1 MAG: endoglucanase Y [Roseibaca calidilacus]CUX82882.1 endoglucanase [Roseibaca calidilacus]
MKRRDFLYGSAAAVFAGSSMAQGLVPEFGQTAQPLWQAWRDRFMRPDGRVVDTLQDQASHSEGQGYGMLLASHFDDTEAFAKMFQWTERNLAIRSDPLLAWRWLPDAVNAVPDRNNASDGDLFYAWALVRAAARFEDRAYMTRAKEIAQALAATCIVPMPGASGRTLLLPAQFGFNKETHVTINPSYYMPLAMREVAAVTGVSELAICAQHGEAFLDQLAQDGLVPDWVDVSADGITASEALSANTGYEAMRVPLFLTWSRSPRHLAVRRMAGVYARTVQPGVDVPTVLEPISGSVLETSADAGYQAVAGLITCTEGAGPGALIPPFTPDQPYYPATLHLFAMIAAHETLPECVPL